MHGNDEFDHGWGWNVEAFGNQEQEDGYIEGNNQMGFEKNRTSKMVTEKRRIERNARNAVEEIHGETQELEVHEQKLRTSPVRCGA